MLPIAKSESLDRTASKNGQQGFRIAYEIAVFALLLGIFLLLAWRSGTFTNELSGETDEAAHFVTGLMVHDYVTRGIPRNPIEFASEFYLHYPKVALGHWPPLFYVLQAGWMCVFGASPAAVILLMVVVTSVLAFLLFRLVRSEFHSAAAGIGAALLLLCLPPIQAYGRMIMADVLVGLFSFCAVLAWADFMETERRRSAVWFAAAATTAILTKGNGFALTVVPPIAIAVSRRWSLFKNNNLWFAALIVGILTGPWTVMTHSMVTNGWEETFGISYFLRGGWFYFTRLMLGPGILITVFALIGVVVKVVAPMRSGGVKPIWASAFALVAANQIFHTLVPAAFEVRFITGSFAPYLLFAVAGISWIANGFRATTQPSYVAAGCALLGAVVFFTTVFQIPMKRSYGFDEIATKIVSDPAMAHVRLMCASNADGEGLLIAEVARRERRPGHIITRATQMLASIQWNGQDYRMLVNSPAEVEERLAAIPADVVVLDRTPGVDIPHVALLAKTLGMDPRWKLDSVYPQKRKPTTMANARIELYRWSGPARPDTGRLRVALRSSPKLLLLPANQAIPK